MFLVTLVAASRRFDLVHALRHRAALGTQGLGLKDLGYFVAGIAILIAARANDEAFRAWLSVNIRLVRTFHAKYSLTNGRPYGRMSLDFFGWNEALCLV
jgi:hypothetical protein